MTTAHAQPIEPKQDRSVATRLRLLDAAVDELIDHGYGGLTTSAVANRAGVSRGAQQRYFPHKDVLVTEAVRHLAQRQHAELAERVEGEPGEPARVARVLDTVFEQYRGRLFGAMLELSLAGRNDPDLARIAAEEERAVLNALQNVLTDLHTPDDSHDADFGQRWSMAIATARGIAMLHLLGHPAEVVDRQWSFCRTQLLSMLLDESDERHGANQRAGVDRRLQ